MGAADRLIEEIVAGSRIPSARRRADLSRELKAHVEDFVAAARRAGNSDAETERLMFAHFGDARRIAEQFGWVYRRQRRIHRLSVFLLSTLAVASVVVALILSLQAAIAIGSGGAALGLLRTRHILIEGMDILASAAACLGLLSFERLLPNSRWAAASLGLTAGAFAVGLRLAGGPWLVPIIGLAIALFLRGAQALLKNPAARAIAVPASFAAVGFLSFRPTSVASWLAAGIGYLAMSQMASRVDRAIDRRLQEV